MESRRQPSGPWIASMLGLPVNVAGDLNELYAPGLKNSLLPDRQSQADGCPQDGQKAVSSQKR